MKQGDLVTCAYKGVSNPCRITRVVKNILTVKDSSDKIYTLNKAWFSKPKK
jgi:hypothetical protein